MYITVTLPDMIVDTFLEGIVVALLLIGLYFGVELLILVIVYCCATALQS